MDKIQRLILENQREIMRSQLHQLISLCLEETPIQQRVLIENINKTDLILNPTKDNEPCCDMKKDAKCEVSEQ